MAAGRGGAGCAEDSVVAGAGGAGRSGRGGARREAGRGGRTGRGSTWVLLNSWDDLPWTNRHEGELRLVLPNRDRWAVALGAGTELRSSGPAPPLAQLRPPGRGPRGHLAGVWGRGRGVRLCSGGFVPTESPSRILGLARRPCRESWVVAAVSEAPGECCLLVGLGKLPLRGDPSCPAGPPRQPRAEQVEQCPHPRGNAKPAVWEPLARDAARGGLEAPQEVRAPRAGRAAGQGPKELGLIPKAGGAPGLSSRGGNSRGSLERRGRG